MNAGVSGAITSVAIKSLPSDPPATGNVQLINGANESETFAYTSWTESGGVYTFTVSTTLSYTYLTDDTAKSTEALLIKTTTIDETDKDTGVFVVQLDADTRSFQSAVEGSSEILGCLFEHKVLDGSADLIFVSVFKFICLNIVDDDGALPPEINGNYYTKTETNALLAGKMELVPTATEDNIFTADALGQAKDSGVSINDLGGNAYDPADSITASVDVNVALPYKQYLMDASGGHRTVTIPNATVGASQWFSITQIQDGNHVEITTVGGTQTFGETGLA